MSPDTDNDTRQDAIIALRRVVSGMKTTIVEQCKPCLADWPICRDDCPLKPVRLKAIELLGEAVP
jgi:hypothetical protein